MLCKSCGAQTVVNTQSTSQQGKNGGFLRKRLYQVIPENAVTIAIIYSVRP
jgi:hypothetical protein